MNERLFEALYGACKQGYITLFRLPDKHTNWYKVQDYRAAYADALEFGKTANTYFGIAVQRKELADGQRGSEDNILTVTTLYADIDVKGPAHKQDNLPQSREEAESFLNALPFAPSVIVWSGNGIHAYWFLEQPYIIGDDDDKQHISAISRGFGEFVSAEGKKRGWKLDTVSDLPRVLRVPGTINHKLQNGATCEVVSFSGARYPLDAFLEYKSTAPPPPEREEIEGIVAGPASRILEKCAFIQHCKTDAKTLPEPEWHAMISNLSLAQDGPALVHELSKPYAGYKKSETDEKIARAIKENKPHTCATIKNHLGFECPHTCISSGGAAVKAPVVHCILSRAEQMEKLLAEPLDANVVFSESVIALLAFAKQNLPAAFGRFKVLARGKIPTKELDRAIDLKIKSSAQETSEDTAMPLKLPDIDLGGAVQPPNWKVTVAGIQKPTYNKSGFLLVTVSPIPIVLTRRMTNIDDNTEKLEVKFYRDGHWKSILASPSQIFNRNALIKFADSGIIVSSESSGDIVKYLADYNNANIKIIPTIRSVGRIGWLNKEFFPFVTETPIVFESDYKEASDIMNSLNQTGSFEAWLKAGAEVRKNPFGRFLLAASFAAPLVEKLGHRVFFVHIWHDSKSGKTAALKYAVSAWGDPKRLVASFNATAVGLERMADTMKHLPFAIDELQALNERRMSIEDVVYEIASGFGRVRGGKDGGIQDKGEWRTIIITSGEQPMSSDTSNDGVTSRVLELYGKPMPDEAFAHSLHQISEQNFGFAGKQYIQYVISHVLSKRGQLKKDYERMEADLAQTFKQRSGHLDNAAIVCLGDYYASLSVFGLEEKEAWDEAVTLGAEIMANNKSLEKEDAVLRAWDFIVQWFIANKGRFSNDAIPCYGEVKGKRVYINVNVLRDALTDAGFSYSKITRGLRDRNLLKTEKEKDGNRMQMQCWINGVNARFFCIELDAGITSGIEPLTGDSEP